MGRGRWKTQVLTNYWPRHNLTSVNSRTLWKLITQCSLSLFTYKGSLEIIYMELEEWKQVLWIITPHDHSQGCPRKSVHVVLMKMLRVSQGIGKPRSEWLARGTVSSKGRKEVRKFICPSTLRALRQCCCPGSWRPRAVPWLLLSISGSHGASSWCRLGQRSRMRRAGAELRRFEWHSLTSGPGGFCPCTWSRPPPLRGKGKKLRQAAELCEGQKGFRASKQRIALGL